MPLHVTKVGVWCAVSATGIIEPIFFLDTAKSARYSAKIVAIVLNPNAEDNKYLFFQQNGSIALQNLGGGIEKLVVPCDPWLPF
jgi:hypothetical protein